MECGKDISGRNITMKMSLEQVENKLNPFELKRQIALPRSGWSSAFQEYIACKIEEKEKREKELRESTAEETDQEMMEKTYARYLKGFMFTEDDLRDKKIIDMGSGDGEFIAALTEKKITEKAHGIDAEPSGFSKNEKYKKHFTRSTFESGPVISDADFWVSYGAVSDGIWGGEEQIDMRKVLKNALHSVNEDGEVRIFPIQVSGEDRILEGLKDSYKVWNEILPDIARTENVTWELKPVDINIVGRENDVVLQEMLVLKKKK